MQVRNRIATLVVPVVALSVLLGGVALLSGCGDEHAHHAAPVPAPAANGAAPRAQASEPVGRVVQANFELVEALSLDDADRARRAAEQTRDQVRALPEEHAGQVQTMDTALAQVIEAEDLAGQRKAFEPFSHELIELVRAQGAGDAGETHVALCWMVNGGDAFWLQPQREITNPYHGSGMYRCGRIVETVGGNDE